MKPIMDVATSLGIDPRHVEPYGQDKAKIALRALDAAARGTGTPGGRLILVSAITPTPAGEGKTTTSIGLVQGMALNGVRAVAALREPSLGPYLGMKGGGSGGASRRSSRPTTSTCTSPATSTRSARRTTCSPRSWTTTCTMATNWDSTRGASCGGARST